MSVLADIVARKRADLAERKARVSLAELQARARPTTRSLAEALRQSGPRFILECKQASPSEGLLRSDYAPADIARDYAPFAAAISVLTDGPYFQGDFAHLRAVRAAVERPVLCKDFVLEPYQVVEARGEGADAVLLMLSVLDDAGYRDCAAAAAALAMDVLTEVHDEAELARALALGAKIIGINNRDLKTLNIDLGTTARLAPRIPRDRLIVCESGIRSRADIEAVSAQVDGFLVGSRLMKSARLDLGLRELLHGAVKVCGLKSAAAARAAHGAGASLGGLIFAPESPRAVSTALAREIAAASPLPLVGVFVDAPEALVAERARELDLVAVQLHGEEDAAYVSRLRERLPAACEIWKAVRVRGRVPELAETGADRLLLDGYDEGARGGSGRAFDWGLLDGRADKARLILAGGLSAENIRGARAQGCFALDVNSGVESAPGVKDEEKLRRLFAVLRGEA